MGRARRRVDGGEVLDDRALNRATLARQLLLERSPPDAIAAVVERSGDDVTLVVRSAEPSTRGESMLRAEGRRLMRLIAPRTGHHVRVTVVT